MRKVYLLGNDISDKITSIAEIEVNAGDYGQLTINDLPSMTGNNQRGFWDTNNPASPFYGALELSLYTIQIYNNDVLVFEGVIHAISADNQNKTANITLKSDIQKKLEKGLIYASSDNSNPALMVSEICSLYKIDIDAASFGQASAIYETDLVRTSAFFRGEGTVQDGIQQILEIGIGRVYSQNNRLFYDVFVNKSTPGIFTFSDKEDNDAKLYSHPEIANSEKEPIYGYKIDYIAGSAVFGDDADQGKTISGNYSNPVRIMTLQAAVWIGEKWLNYFGSKQNIISFSVAAKYGKSLNIDYPINIEYRGKSYTLDLIGINKSLALETKLRGLTR